MFQDKLTIWIGKFIWLGELEKSGREGEEEEDEYEKKKKIILDHTSIIAYDEWDFCNK